MFNLSLVMLGLIAMGQSVNAQSNCKPFVPNAPKPEQVAIPSFKFEVFDDGKKITQELPAQVRAFVRKAVLTHSIPDEIIMDVKFDKESGIYTSKAKVFKLPERPTISAGRVRDRLEDVTFRVNHEDRDDDKIVNRRTSHLTLYSDFCGGHAVDPNVVQRIDLQKWNEAEGTITEVRRNGDLVVGEITQLNGTSLKFMTAFLVLSRKDRSEAIKKLQLGNEVRLYYSTKEEDPNKEIQIPDVMEVDFLN